MPPIRSIELRPALLSRKPNWYAARASHLPPDPGNRLGVGQLEFRDALEPYAQRHIHLHAREVGSGTTMDADAKGNMPVLLAIQDDFVGSIKNIWIVVGSREIE